MSSLFATTKQKELLVFGYGRINFKRCDIPIPLTTIMFTYFNTNVHVTFKDESLKEFLNMGHSKCVTPFEPCFIDGIKFENTLYPNGTKQNDLGLVTFCLKMSFPHSNVDSVIIYSELHCKETQTYLKGTRQCNVNNSPKGEWTVQMVKLSKCKSKKALNFCVYTHILKINFKHIKAQIFYERIAMQQRASFAWNFKRKLLLLIKGTDINGDNCYFSANFGRNQTWYLRFRPDVNSVGIALFHRSFPPNIDKIGVHYSVTFICEEKAWVKSKKRTLERDDFGGAETNFKLSWMDIISTSHIKILIALNIFEAFDANDKPIQSIDFCRYGIV